MEHPETNATVIVVNDSASLLRQRFSIAHELGHIRIHHGLAGCSVSGQVKRSPTLEASANVFASGITDTKDVIAASWMPCAGTNCESLPGLLGGRRYSRRRTWMDVERPS